MYFNKISFWSLCFITIWILSGCDNEPYEGPLTEFIPVDSELYKNIEQIANSQEDAEKLPCVVFIYPFNIYLYDENEEIAGGRIVEDNISFLQILENREEGTYVGLSYPIQSKSLTGEELVINNNEELEKALKRCIEKQIIRKCEELLEDDCIWTITSLYESERYNTSVIDFYESGDGVFYDQGTSYRMSWVPLFIENNLYINMKLEGDSQVATYWNRNWQAFIEGDTIILFEAEERHRIEKKCKRINECDYVEFEECDMEFPLETYYTCIVSLQEDVSDPDEVLVFFYETITDQESGVNELPIESYRAKDDPQILFVTLENEEVGYSKKIQIVLTNRNCTEN